MWSQELDSMIPMCPFQYKIICYYVSLLCLSWKHLPKYFLQEYAGSKDPTHLGGFSQGMSAGTAAVSSVSYLHRPSMAHFSL